MPEKQKQSDCHFERQYHVDFKNVGSFAKYLSSIRGKEKYVRAKQRVERKLNQTPVIGAPMIKMLKSSKDAVRDTIFRSTTHL